MRARKLVGTSWKMHLTSSETEAWFAAFLPAVAGLHDRELFVLPPFTSIWVARACLATSDIAWGAQDVHPDDAGAHTGDVSAPMLADLGCRIVEAGHSERRREHGETPPLIARKVAAILRWGMRPLLCIGEPERARFESVSARLLHDLGACLAQVAPADRARVMVAYEPVWAIGAGARAAPRDHVARVHVALHDWLEAWSAGAAVPVLYGGSVDPEEAEGLLDEPAVDGLFVGRHALDPLEFARIARAGLDRRPGGAARAEGGAA